MKVEQVVELFQHLNKELRISKNAKYWLGQCLNPNHQDKRPSLRISVDHPHSFKCYSCGFSGTLSNLAKNLGLEIDTKVSFKTKTKLKLPDIANLVLEPWTDNYRGLTAEHYKYFGAMKWLDYTLDNETQQYVLSAERLWFPVYTHGLFTSYFGRRIDDSTFIKYKNYEGMLTTETLWPYDNWQPTHPIVLVEGPLDAVKFNLYNIPALCIFGVQNWSNYKLKLVLQKCPSTIWLCMDNDKAGNDAQAKIYNKIKGYGDVQCIQLPEGVDPFDLHHDLTTQVYNEIWARHIQKTSPVIPTVPVIG